MPQAASFPVGTLYEVAIQCSQKTLMFFIPCSVLCFVMFILLWNLAFLPSWRQSRFCLWNGIGIVIKSFPVLHPQRQQSGFCLHHMGVPEPDLLHLPTVLGLCRWPTDKQSAPHPTSSLQGAKPELGDSGSWHLAIFRRPCLMDGQAAWAAQTPQWWLRWWCVSPLTSFWAVK